MPLLGESIVLTWSLKHKPLAAAELLIIFSSSSLFMFVGKGSVLARFGIGCESGFYLGFFGRGEEYRNQPNVVLAKF